MARQRTENPDRSPSGDLSLAYTQIPRLEFLPTVHARAVAFAGCLAAGDFPQSVLGVVEDSMDGQPDPNDILTRRLDESVLAHGGAHVALAGYCAERVLWRICHGLREAAGTDAAEQVDGVCGHLQHP